MVLPNLFGSYNNEPHRGLVTCLGKDTGGPESKSFTASGLTKITLQHGCTAETDTHIFAAADNGFSRSENEYTVLYMWPFDPSTLTPGLDTKKFSDIIRRNLTRLANNTRHSIPLEVALRAVGAKYGVPLNMNDVLDEHHYVTVLINYGDHRDYPDHSRDLQSSYCLLNSKIKKTGPADGAHGTGRATGHFVRGFAQSRRGRR
jgi:hypothetical protein